MEPEAAQIPPLNLVEELARREQQLENMRLAYLELQEQQGQDRSVREQLMKTVSQLPIFTGTGEVTVNSFFSSTEYLLSTITNAALQKEAVRTIFYRTIQGQAKDVIINVPEPDNWQLIKETLKLRYKPNIEPHQIYRMIANLKVNSVSELIIEVQNIKYKADELTVYYRDDHYIDLSNVDSLLVNTVKEMTQGTLLDKIYEKTNINDILRILNMRRFEDTCIRPEYKKFRRTNYGQGPNNIRDMGHSQNVNQNQTNYNRFNQGNNRQYYQNQDNLQYRQERNFNNNYNSYNPNNSNNNNNNNNFNGNGNFNNSGHYRAQNNNLSGNYRRFAQAGNPRPNVSQNRLTQPRQSQNEPMEVDNLQVNNIQRFLEGGNPRPNVSQNCLTQPGQDQEEHREFLSRETDQFPVAGQSEVNLCQCNTNPSKRDQYKGDTFFMEQPQIIYPR